VHFSQGDIEMELKDSVIIPAARASVWKALNDPEVLRRCIPGCEELEMISETELKGVVVIKVGPIKARFTGDVTLGDLDPPNGYVLSGAGKGGVAWHGKGGCSRETHGNIGRSDHS
jgi:carbon monoxide dehydrogenase subunit G